MESLIDRFDKFQHNLRKQRVINARQILMQAIVDQMQSPPDHASIKFGQDELLNQSNLSEILMDTNAGVLYIEVSSNFAESPGKHSYSLFFTGDLFRIGLLLYDGLQNATVIDWHNEVHSLWPGTQPDHLDREGLTMYEWTFLLPDLYGNYATQERYILGMRHMHCRMLRIIRDYKFLKIRDAANDVLIEESNDEPVTKVNDTIKV